MLLTFPVRICKQLQIRHGKTQRRRDGGKSPNDDSLTVALGLKLIFLSMIRIQTIYASIAKIPKLKNRKSFGTRGFTLIEIMVVVLILGVFISMGIRQFSRSFGSQVKAQARGISALTQAIHNHARLRQQTYRLVIDFGNEKTRPSYYVEGASTRELVQGPDAKETFHSSDKKKTSPFTLDPTFSKKPREIPRGAIFEDVEIEGFPKPFTEGKAYINFFPQGLVQKAIIHIADEKKNIHYSLIIHPLTAVTHIRTEYVKLKDLE